MTIDECLYNCRNQWAGKVYNPNKPHPYGINFKCLNEVLFPYTYRSEVYAGKPDIEDLEYYIPNTLGITKRLLEKYGWQKLKGSNLTTDNLYGSIPLAQLLLEKNMMLISTMRSNRKGLAKAMKDVQDREENSTIVWHEKAKGKMTVTSYTPLTKSSGMKNILALSTIPNLPSLGVTRDDGKVKSALLKTYDMTKGGTDICDQRKDSYTSNTKSRRWTKKILCYMLDETRVNAQTVLALNQNKDPRKVISFDFGWALAK